MVAAPVQETLPFPLESGLRVPDGGVAACVAAGIAAALVTSTVRITIAQRVNWFIFPPPFRELPLAREATNSPERLRRSKRLLRCRRARPGPARSRGTRRP